MKNIIIIDLGSYSVKIGTSKKKTPQFCIQSIMGTSKRNGEILYGKEVLEKTEDGSPLIRYIWDIIQIRWNTIFDFFDYIFKDKLHISLKELQKYSVFLLIPPLQPRSHYLKYYEAFFTRFKVKNMIVFPAPRVVTIASGRLNGTVVDIGHKSTRVLPFYEGWKLSHAFIHQDLGGKDIEKNNKNIIEAPQIPEKDYLMPTSKLIIKSIELCDEEIQDKLYSNIILTGWWSANNEINTLLEGGLRKERENKPINIFAPSTHYYNWICGSQLASNQFQKIAKTVYLTRKKYHKEKDSEQFLTLAGIKTKKWGLISYPL
jgi:actin-related protein